MAMHFNAFQLVKCRLLIRHCWITWFDACCSMLAVRCCLFDPRCMAAMGIRWHRGKQPLLSMLSERPWNRVDRPQWLKQVECAKQWRQCTLPFIAYAAIGYIAIRCIAISNYHRNLRSFVQACSTQFNAQLMAVFQVSISCTTESTGENNTESVHQKRPPKGSTKSVLSCW